MISVSTPAEKANQEHIETLFQLLNGMCNDDQYTRQLIGQLRKTHRTLQQNFFRMISKVVNEKAKEEFYDLRNEASIEWSKKAAEATQDVAFPFI